MRLSRKDEHSITAMLSLAAHDRYTAPISLSELSEDLGISTSYLEHLFSGLRKHGLVEGLRGVGGGYRLTRPAAQISIADILYATDALSDESGNIAPDAPDTRGLEAAQAWAELSRRIRDFLGGLTLADFTTRKPDNRWKHRGDSVSGYIASMFPPHAIRSGMSA
ncbi:MAG: Rrf2 family transcriptional regulator [Thiothrix sp.]|uniref:Rrf2 family transcriptional regulator n=1 Tax=Thiothrix sp. TaxID=1032 RepID=UPI00260DB792|nr:Rrf2 family transcriptional regulator [Thiothrix sp.]MDD5394340.1 Rrf2 family transcriptional regulator [Thiothrix sp.]